MDVEKTKKMVDDAIGALASALEQGESDTLKAYLAAMGRFHRYSLGNAMLIAFARPGATRVAGFRTWQKLGRRVRKGELGIAILPPIARRRKPRTEAKERTGPDERNERASSDAGPTVLGFRTAYVFDVAQTDGKELAEFAKIEGEPIAELARLKQHVTEQGLQLRYAGHLGGAEGMSVGGTIVLRAGQAAPEEFSTLVHELAHERLHHDGVQRSRVVKETEAEAVAYAVNAAVGLELNSASRDYIHLYDGKKEALIASLERIRSVATEIIGAVLSDRSVDENSAGSNSGGTVVTTSRRQAAA